jgi:hypothetical protein
VKHTRDRVRPRVEPLDPRISPAVFGNPWPDPDLTLSFAPDGTDVNGSPSRLAGTFAGIPTAVWQREVLRAFQTWVSVADVDVGVVADGGQPAGAAGAPQADGRFGDVRVAAVPLAEDAAALALPFDPTAGTRAGDVWFNAAETFGTAGSPGFDVYSVALHESGHVLGVAGSADPQSVMFQAGVATRTGLSPADVAAVVALYGPRSADRFEEEGGNDTLGTATEARYNSGDRPARRKADLTTPADVDVYSFRAEGLDDGEGVTVTVRTGGLSLVVPRLEVLDESGKVIASGVGGGPGVGDVLLRLTGLEEGETYFARVTSGADPTFAVGRYELVIRPDRTEDDGDELDDPEQGTDDTPDMAVDLRQEHDRTNPRYDYRAAASLSTPTDVDFFRLRSPRAEGESAGVMTATVWATSPGPLDPMIAVFDEFGAPVPAAVLVRDGGAYTIQVADAAADQDYYVAVRHARPGAGAAGDYSFGVDFGGAAAALQPFAAGTLTAAAPVQTTDVTVSPGQVLHLVLTAGPAPAAAGVRVSVLGADDRLLGSRFAAGGETVSLSTYLPAGTYRLLAAGGTTDGSATPDLAYTVRGLSVSDPVGPRGVDVTLRPDVPVPVSPPPPPVATPSAPRPQSPVTPVQPTGPNWIITPPTDWPAPPAEVLRPADRPRPRVFTIASATDPRVRVYNPDGTAAFAVDPGAAFTGGVRVAAEDFTGDGTPDVVLGTGPGGPTAVRVLDGVTKAELFTVAPFEATFTGGVFVAAGDITGDGKADLVITPDEGGGPRVRMFDGNGFGLVSDFFGIADPAFRGGARAAVGDVNGDGVGDLVVAAGFQGGPRVATFDGKSLGGGQAPRVLFNDSFAFEQTLRNGVFVAAGDIDGDGFAEVIAGGGPGGGPRVTAFSGKSLLANAYDETANFFGGDPAERGGVRVAVKDLDGDTRADLVTGAGTAVRAFFGKDVVTPGEPGAAFDLGNLSEFAGGVFVG